MFTVVLKFQAGRSGPFAPGPLQALHHYYEPVRPRAPPRYSRLVVTTHLCFSLSIGATGSHVPHKSLVQVHAASMPGAAWSVGGLSPRLIPESSDYPGFDGQPFPFDTSSAVHLRSSPWTPPDRLVSGLFPNAHHLGTISAAAWGGLEPAPAGRLRRAFLHLSCSIACFWESPPFGFAFVAHSDPGTNAYV